MTTLLALLAGILAGAIIMRVGIYFGRRDGYARGYIDGLAVGTHWTSSSGVAWPKPSVTIDETNLAQLREWANEGGA